MTEKGYNKEEIIKGERIILQVSHRIHDVVNETDEGDFQSLEFNISPYCSPYSWVRRISKADDYDIQTRTLSKFLMEVTLLDHRFLRARPSMIAAIGMYLARQMLGGEWVSCRLFPLCTCKADERRRMNRSSITRITRKRNSSSRLASCSKRSRRRTLRSGSSTRNTPTRVRSSYVPSRRILMICAR